MTDNELTILTNIIGACESGGMVYGKRDYSIYAGAYHTTSSEVTCTLGWACFYGDMAQKLVKNIFNADKEAFRKIDTDGIIENKLSVSWVNTKWNPTSDEAAVLKKLIVTDIGKKCQDDLFKESMKTIIGKALEYDKTMSVAAQMMWCEIAHLGGYYCCKNRIFPRAEKPYTPETIYASLLLDQNDTSSSNQVGDKLFINRHKYCVEWINKYVVKAQTATATTTTVKSLTATSATKFLISKTASPNKTKQFVGQVKVNTTLECRTWAGTSYSKCSFSPFKNGVKVNVCDAILDKSGQTWYFVEYNGKYGFSCAKYIVGI